MQHNVSLQVKRIKVRKEEWKIPNKNPTYKEKRTKTINLQRSSKVFKKGLLCKCYQQA